MIFTQRIGLKTSSMVAIRVLPFGLSFNGMTNLSVPNGWLTQRKGIISPNARAGRIGQVSYAFRTKGSSKHWNCEAIHHCPLKLYPVLITAERPFDINRLIVRLYSRPSNAEARAVVIVRDNYKEHYYSLPLTDLKIIRKFSRLDLCLPTEDLNKGTLWARLNFVFYESECVLQ